MTEDHKTRERRMAAILAADLEDHSARVSQAEEPVLAQVRALLADIVTPGVDNAGGRVVKTMGDGFLAEFDRAHALSPRDPFLFNIEFSRGSALSLLGDHEGAVRRFRIRLEAGPGVVWADRDPASFHSRLGHAEKAAEAMAKFVAHHPGITGIRIHGSMPPSAMVHHPTFLDGLRRAGLPDA